MAKPYVIRWRDWEIVCWPNDPTPRKTVEVRSRSPIYAGAYFDPADLAKVRKRLPLETDMLIRSKQTLAGRWCGIEMGQARAFLDSLRPWMRDNAA